VDVNVKIDELIEIVESARAMPMSASCVINRSQVLDLLDELRKAVPEEMDRAKRVLADRESVVAEGRREADRLLERTRSERESIIGNTDVSREARGAAERIMEQARREAEQIRTDADDYVDQKLANFEVVLTKTLQSVGRGRDKMRGTHTPMEELGRHVDEQDAMAEERKRSRSFTSEPSTGTGEFERPQFTEDGYSTNEYQDDPQPQYQPEPGYQQEPGYQPEPGYQQEPGYQPEPAYRQEPAYQQEAGYQDGGYDQGQGHSQDQGHGNRFDAYETQNFTAVAFDEAERPYEPHLQHQEQQPQQPQGYPVDEYQRYDTGEQPQYGYEPAAYDAGAAQGYGTGEFQIPEQQYGYDTGYGQQAPTQAGPGQVEVVQYGAVPEDTSYFDTGLIDVRQFQQEGYGR
jgi:hypothetical protein